MERLVFGMAVVGCDNDSTGGNGGGGEDSALNGTWVREEPRGESALKFNNGNYEGSFAGIPQEKGTYTTNSGTMTMKRTHIHGDYIRNKEGEGAKGLELESKWYSENDLIKIRDNDHEGYVFWKFYFDTFRDSALPYSITGNTLTFNNILVYTRK